LLNIIAIIIRKSFNIIDLEEISTNRKDEVVGVLRLPLNRFPGAAGHIKGAIANKKIGTFG
ncbi:sporulation protein, partial [Bacillus thuringiensis]